MLKAFVNENRDDWDGYLPYLTMGYRANVHKSTNCTPNIMMFVRENHLPIDVMMGPPPRHVDKYICPVKYVEWLWQAMAQVHEHPQQHLDSSAKQQNVTMTSPPTLLNIPQNNMSGDGIPLQPNRNLVKVDWTIQSDCQSQPIQSHPIPYQHSTNSRRWSQKVHIDQVRPHLGRTPTIRQNHTLNQTMPEL